MAEGAPAGIAGEAVRYRLTGECTIHRLDVREGDTHVVVSGRRQWMVPGATATLLGVLAAGPRSAIELRDLLLPGQPELTGDMVCARLDASLVAAGLLERADDARPPRTPDVPRAADGMLFRFTLVPARLVAGPSGALRWLFDPRTVFVGLPLLVLAIVGAALWGPVAQGVPLWRARWMLRPESLLLGVLGTFVHELGHAAACRRFGCRHGALGFGVYFAFPVLYMELDDCWRLPRLQRAVVDAGGMYAQVLFALVLLLVGALTGSWPSVAGAAGVTLVSVAMNANPLLRFDGYWLLSDLTGVANLRARAFRAVRYALPLPGRRAMRETTPAPSLPLLAYGALCAVTLALYLGLVAHALPGWLAQYPGSAARLLTRAEAHARLGEGSAAAVALVSLLVQTAALAGMLRLLARLPRPAGRMIAAAASRVRAAALPASRPPAARASPRSPRHSR